MLVAVSGTLSAQTAPTGKTYKGCYVASTGTVYIVAEPGTPAACGASHKASDVAINVYDGGDALRTSSTAGGDVTGNFGTLTVAGLRGLPVSTVAPTTGQVLQWNGTIWAPATVGGAIINYNRTSGQTAIAGNQSQDPIAALAARSTAQTARIDALQAENAALRARLERIEAKLR